jgi:hypothetical protein
MVSNPVIRLVRTAPAIKDGPLAGLMKRLGRGRFASALAGYPLKVADDPYLLVLLADQELVDGREEQARYLIEAAYERFDHKRRAGVPRLHLAG